MPLKASDFDQPQSGGWLQNLNTRAFGPKAGKLITKGMDILALPYTYPAAAAQVPLGALQRGVSGLLAHQPGQNPLGAAGYEITHPSQQAQFTHQLREKFNINPERLDKNYAQRKPWVQALEQAGADVGAETVTDPLTYLGGMGLVKNAGRTLARGFEVGIPKVMERMGPAMTQLARISQVAPRLKSATTPMGKAAVLTAENAAGTIAKQTADESRSILTKHKNDVITGQWPPAVRNEFQRWRYIFGDQDTRNAALAAGYKPTEREKTLPLLNAMTLTKEDYKPKTIQAQEQAPELGIGLRTKRKAAPGFVKHQTAGPAEDQFKSAMDKIDQYEKTFKHSLANELTLQRVSPLPPDITQTLREIKAARDAGKTVEVARLQKVLAGQRTEFQAAQNALRESTAPGAKTIDLREFLAKNPAGYLTEAQYGPGLFRQALRNVRPGMKGTEIPFGAKAGETTTEMGKLLKDEVIPEYERLVERQLGRPLPEGVAQHRFGQQQTMGEFKVLKNASDATRLMLFMSFVRHGFFNVPFLQAIGPGGATAAIEGIGRVFVSPGRAQAIRRLEDMGAASHYIRQPAEGAGPVMNTLSKMAKPATSITERADMSQRIALLSYLDRSPQYAKMKDYEKGQLINDTLMDYSHQSDLSNMLRSYTGAQFPHWRLTLIAHAVKAMLQNPRAVDMITRGQVDLNRHLGYNVDLATPLDTGLKAYGDPLKFAKATIPPATSGYDVLTAKKGKAGQALLNDLIYYFTPAGLGGLLQQQLGTSTYKQYGPTDLREILSAGGAHLSKQQGGY